MTAASVTATIPIAATYGQSLRRRALFTAFGFPWSILGANLYPKIPAPPAVAGPPSLVVTVFRPCPASLGRYRGRRIGGLRGGLSAGNTRPATLRHAR